MTFITLICAAFPPLVLVMVLPLIAIPYILKARHNRYTWLAVVGMIVTAVAMTMGSNAIAVVYKEGRGGDTAYTNTSFFAGNVVDTITGLRFLGFVLAAGGLLLCVPWYRTYQKWAYENLVLMDKANIAIAYFVFMSVACSLFWFF